MKRDWTGPILKEAASPKVVQKRLGHASIQVTLDTYSQAAPGLQKAAAKSFDKLVCPQYNETIESAVLQDYY
jgi:integrase